MREMKDSSENWLGSIPAKWKMARIKDVIKILTDYTANGSFADLAKNVKYLDYEDFARLVRLTDLRSKLNNPGVYVSQKSYEYLGKSKLYGKEILVANVGAYAGLFCEMPNVDIPATLGPNMFLIRTNSKMYSHYLYYLGNTHFVKEQLAQKAISSAQPKLNKTDIKTAYIIIPPILEQKRIISFLDSQCSEIDAISADIQKEIEILEQYKRSVITEAVTKGLNPDVEMKDSGVRHIGKIPADWKSVKIKYLAKERSENGLFNPEKDHYIGLENVASYSNSLIKTETEYTESLQNKVYCGDVMFSRLRPYLAKVIIAPFDCFSTGEFLQLYGYIGDKRYLRYNMLSVDFIKEVNMSTYGAKMPRANSEFIINLKIPQPPVAEQKQIADFLDSKCKDIESAIADKKRQFEVLDSYKKSLIYEYVTGKKEVPNYG